MNAEQAIYQEKKRKIIEEEETKMTGDTVPEELNTDLIEYIAHINDEEPYSPRPPQSC